MDHADEEDEEEDQLHQEVDIWALWVELDRVATQSPPQGFVEFAITATFVH